MIATIKQFNVLIEPTDRKKLAFIFLITLVTGCFEVAGIASIMPFISVLSQPNIVEEYSILKSICQILGISSSTHFLIFLGTAMLGLLILVGCLGATTVWITTRFTYMQGHHLSLRLLVHYLNKPYAYFLHHNSADMGKQIQAESQELIQYVLFPFIMVLVRGIVCLFILGFLLWVDPILAFSIFGFLVCTYGVVYWSVRGKLRNLGKVKSTQLGLRYRVVMEAFAAIKEVKVFGAEDSSAHQYDGASRGYAKAMASHHIISQLPQYAIESAAFTAIISMILYLVLTKGNFGTALPILAAYGLAAQRMLPSVKRIFDGLTSIRAHAAVLEDIYCELQSSNSEEVHRLRSGEQVQTRAMPVAREIVLRDLRFSYPGSIQPVFNKLNLVIKAKTSVGFVGSTGAGKTTLVDLIMGLLVPDAGEISVDGVLLNSSNIRSWQKAVGYVPQHIYLSDKSFAENIAFGIPSEEIDRERVEQASKIANIHDFIVRELPQGYDTLIGENGVRLSGGQRQRVGIARALYKDPAVLVLDEATSALDSETESAVMDAISKLNHQKTILIVAHRLSTLAGCDEVVDIRG